MTNNMNTVVTDLPITKKQTTMVITPSAAADGFDKNCYDTAELTTMLWVNNDSEREVEIPLPFPTEKFSASIAVVSAGEDIYSDRIEQVARISGDLSRYNSYLQKIGIPQDVISDQKKLRETLKGFRSAKVHLPAGQIVIRIQSTMVIDPIVTDTSRKSYSFRAYAPLPSFIPIAGRAPMTLTVIFKGYEGLVRTITKFDVSNPFGPDVPINGSPIIGQQIIDDTIYAWKWQSDPVVDFTYNYN